jgi:hypothetical protein
MMDGDAYRDMTHAEMQQVIWRRVAAFAEYANVEQRLPNGKIADVFYQVGAVTVIVEVKTLLKASLIENAWNKYNGHCDYLAIAAPPQLMPLTSGEVLTGWRQEQHDRVGLWWVQWNGIVEVRPAVRLKTQMPGLSVVLDPALSPFAVIGSPACTAHRA